MGFNSAFKGLMIITVVYIMLIISVYYLCWTWTLILGTAVSVWSLWYMIYLLTAIGLSAGGSSTVHIYTQTVRGTTQTTTEQRKSKLIWKSVDRVLSLRVFTQAFALHLRKEHAKTSVRVRKTSVRVQYTYSQNNHTLQNLHTCPHITKPTHTHTHPHPHITKQYKTTTV